MLRRIVESVDLSWHCNCCGKSWANYDKMSRDEDIKRDLDYDQMIYFHRCNNSTQ